MSKPMRSRAVAAYATGEHRLRPGLFGFAVCEIRVEEPERSYWKRANAAEWEWCAVADSNITVKLDANTSRLTAKIAEAMADLKALAETAGSLGIVIEADDGEAAEPSESDFDGGVDAPYPSFSNDSRAPAHSHPTAPPRIDRRRP